MWKMLKSLLPYDQRTCTICFVRPSVVITHQIPTTWSLEDWNMSVCIHTEQKTRDNGKGTRKKRYAIYCSDLVIYLFRCKLWTLNPCTDVQTRRKAGHLIQTTGTVKASLSASPGDLEGQKIATRNRRMMIDCVEPFWTSGKAIRNRQLGGQASSRSCRRLRSPFYLLVHAVPWHVRVKG